MAIRIDNVLSLPGLKLPLGALKLKIEEGNSYHLKIITRMRQHSYPNGFEIERFLQYRLRHSPYTPTYYGSVLHKGEYGVLTGFVAEEYPFQTYNFFLLYPDERERLKALLQIFMDIFYQLHQIHGPRYPSRFVPQQSSTASNEVRYAHKDLKPRNLRAFSDGSGLPRAVILDFDVSGAVAQQTVVMHQASWFDPPEYQDPGSAPISIPSRDIFSVSAMLFGAISPDGINLIDTCFGVMHSLPFGKPLEGVYRTFLKTALSDLEEDLWSEFLNHAAPEIHPDRSLSLFGNLVEHSFQQWDLLRAGGEYSDIGNKLRRFILRMADDRAAVEGPTALEAYSLFEGFWERLCEGKPSVDELYAPMGPPREYSDVEFPFNEVRLPIRSSGFDIDLTNTVVGGVFPTITLDWGLRPFVSDEHVSQNSVNAGEDSLVFERIEVTPGTKLLRFGDSSDVVDGAAFSVLLEYGAYTNPIFLQFVFDKRVEQPQWVEKLNIDRFESEIEDHFKAGTLPSAQALGEAIDLWKQAVAELDDALLASDQQRWYAGIAVFLSNLLMIPDDQRRELDLEEITIDFMARDDVLGRNARALVDIAEHIDFAFHKEFLTAACLQMLRQGFVDIEDGRFDRISVLCGAVERNSKSLAGHSYYERLAKLLGVLKALSRFQAEVPRTGDES